MKIIIDGTALEISTDYKLYEIDKNGEACCEEKNCFIAGIPVSENIIIEQYHSTTANTEEEFIQELKKYCEENNLTFEECGNNEPSK